MDEAYFSYEQRTCSMIIKAFIGEATYVQCLSCNQWNVCLYIKDCGLNYPRWLSTVKDFQNPVIMAHSNSIYQQAKAITASMYFDYWLYALMISRLHSGSHNWKEEIPPSIAMHSLLLLPFHLPEQMSPVDLKLCDYGLHGVVRFYGCLWMRGVCICMLPSRAFPNMGAILSLHLQ